MRYARLVSRLGFLFVGLLAIAPAAFGSEIAGKVVLSGERTANVVISIEGLPVPGTQEADVYTIDHRDLDFVPHLLVVRAGTTVRFKNSDGMPCRIYSISPAGTFVLRREDGKPMTLTFDRLGVIEVRCADHPRIYAFLVVKENPYFALTDSKGRYTITDVPLGRYTLEAWYEGKVIQSKSIEIGANKLKVDFKAARPQPRALADLPLKAPSMASEAYTAAGISSELVTTRRNEQ